MKNSLYCHGTAKITIEIEIHMKQYFIDFDAFQIKVYIVSAFVSLFFLQLKGCRDLAFGVKRYGFGSFISGKFCTLNLVS